MLRTLFFVEIAVDEESKRYVARVTATTAGKQIIMVEQSMRLILPRLKKALLQKDKDIRRFPLPDEPRILTPNKAEAGNVLILPNGH